MPIPQILAPALPGLAAAPPTEGPGHALAGRRRAGPARTLVLALLAGWSLTLGPVLAEEVEPPVEDEPALAASSVEEELSPEELLLPWQQAFEAGSYRKALRLIRNLAEEHEDVVEVQLALVEQHLMSGDHRKVGRLLDTLLDDHPEHHGVRQARARLALETGEYELAEQLLRELSEEDIHDLRSRYLLGLLLDEELGRRQEAHKIFESFYDYYNDVYDPEKFELTAEQHLYIGLACQKYQSPHEAINEMTEAVDQNPRLVEAYCATGWLFLEKYDQHKARKEFESALAINPHHPDAHCGIGACHLVEFGQTAEAEEALKKALRVNRSHHRARVLLARARMKMQDYAGALGNLEQALRVNPRSVEALALEGTCQYAAAEMEAYEQVKARLAERGPALEAQLDRELAAHLAERHRYQEAVDFGRRAIELDEDLVQAYVDLGINLTRLGVEWREGKAVLEQAYERDRFKVEVFNLLQLLDDYETQYDLLETEHFRIRLHRDDKDVMGPEVAALLEEAWDDLTAKYQVTPPTPVVVEMFPSHDDFSVRSIGVQWLGALGVCFGQVITLLGPEAMKQKDPTGQERVRHFNWGQTAWHEFTHTITITATGGRIPRWFTEGLSVFEEKERHPVWDRELAIPVHDALRSGKLRGILDLNDGFSRGDEVLLSYYVGSLVCEFINQEWGFEIILEMLRLYREDVDTTGVLQQALGLTPEAFDERFREYLDDVLAPYEIMPRYTRENITTWRHALQELGPDQEGGVEEIVLRSNLGNAYWFNHAIADSEIQSARAINLYTALTEEDAAPVAPEQLERARRAAADSYVVLARIYQQKKRLPKAKEFFDKAFALGCDEFFAHRTRAQLAEEEGDTARAIQEYEAALQAFPRYTEPPDSPYRRLVHLYLEQGEEEKAYGILEAFCSINEEDLEMRRLLAKHLLDAGNVEKLREVLTQARFITCRDAEINSMLGTAFRGVDDPEVRITKLRTALADRSLPDEDRVRLLVDLAEAYKDLGSLQEALDAVEEAVVLDDSYTRSQKLQAEIEALMMQQEGGDQRLQRRRLERRLDNPDLPVRERASALIELSRLLLELEEVEEALDRALEATELSIPIPEAELLVEEIEQLLEEEPE